MIKKKEINPLNVLKARRVKFCPPHFTVANIETSWNLLPSIDSWISDNLKGRYYLDADNKISRSLIIGFENPKELTYFMLACSLLKYNK